MVWTGPHKGQTKGDVDALLGERRADTGERAGLVLELEQVSP